MPEPVCCRVVDIDGQPLHQPGCGNHTRENCPACAPAGLTSVMTSAMLGATTETNHQGDPRMTANHPTFEDGEAVGRMQGRTQTIVEILTALANRAEQVTALARSNLADSRGYAEALAGEAVADPVTFEEHLNHMRRAENAHGRAQELASVVEYVRTLASQATT